MQAQSGLEQELISIAFLLYENIEIQNNHDAEIKIALTIKPMLHT